MQTHMKLIHRALGPKQTAGAVFRSRGRDVQHEAGKPVSLFPDLLTIGVILTKSELMRMCHIPTGQLADWEVAFWGLLTFYNNCTWCWLRSSVEAFDTRDHFSSVSAFVALGTYDTL